MELFDLKLSDFEFKKIRSIVYNATGIHLIDSKRALVVSRLARRLRQLNMDSFLTYINLLESDADEVLLLINRITTNLTKFYREKSQFAVLRNQLFSIIMETKKQRGENWLRVWSAGCSTGEEVYTILFELIEAFNGHLPANLDFKILGSDIDTNVLHKASHACYSSEEIADLPIETRDKYMEKIENNQFRVKQYWRQYVIFRRINLVTELFSFKRKLDIIFCRNVVIYFDKKTRENLYHKFYTVLNDPGYFFSGHSENLFKYNNLFRFVEKSIYKKVV